MAAPHVAGAAALLLSRNPNLTYTEVKELLENNADRDLQDTGTTCGGIPSTEFPNNQYGNGRVNVRKALEAAINA
ncbi:Calcium-dependent protease [Orchesella cincta]|uniref:Calcium-dependent protease n=1 Tax=Orchesella cincta TaxID=48709 RepID=A0A1D2NK75_ORCCI|nr:Calcium-dependent protease [Orchesella cincta]